VTAAAFAALTGDIPYLHRGMFFSYVYLFVQRCLDHGVTAVIESGVRNGLSTRILHRVWPGHVTSVEYRPSHLPPQFPFPVLVGNGGVLVPEWLRTAPASAIGVLCDGPKGAKAFPLRDQCFRFPAVQVVGIHDVPRHVGESVHSHDPDFRQAIGDALDARIAADIRARYPHGAPGLGVWTT